MKILVINAGSSTFKLAIFDMKDQETSLNPIWEGVYDWGAEKPFLSISTKIGKKIEKQIDQAQVEEGFKLLINHAFEGETKVLNSRSEINAVGHRIVHGGATLIQPALITANVKETIRSLIPLAPLHNPYNLKGIEIAESFFPHIPQIAVFDTAFHHTIDEIASTYAGPFDWTKKRIKRYGFHGTSHQYCYEKCSSLIPQDPKSLKIISCHLGNGASLAAIRNGESIDTTMGFTPMEGLMMGTRCGSIDPGILLYLLKEKKESADDLFHHLNYDSGLKGISGITEDMREIIRLKNEGHERAQLAWDMYIHSVQRNIGAMIGLLPLKGITLPFISYGGTSVVFAAAAVGLAFQASQYTTFSVPRGSNTSDRDSGGSRWSSA